jgi:hypothetical protein
VLQVFGENHTITTPARRAGSLSYVDGPPGFSRFRKPDAFAYDSAFDRLLVADLGASTVRAVLSNGIVITVLGNGTGAPWTGYVIPNNSPALGVMLPGTFGVAVGDGYYDTGFSCG